MTFLGPRVIHCGKTGNWVWNCQREMGWPPPAESRVAANRRTESSRYETATRRGCWCSTAEVRAEMSALRSVPGGRTAENSGEAPECSIQSGPWARSPGVGHRGRIAAGSRSVAQSAAAATRPVVPCPWASQNCPVRTSEMPQYRSIGSAKAAVSAAEAPTARRHPPPDASRYTTAGRKRISPS